MRAEMWETERRVRRLLQITFILLNPLSHSAVLTGMVLTQFIMSRIADGIVAPRVSLYSLKACLTSRNPVPNWNAAFPLGFRLCGAQKR